MKTILIMELKGFENISTALASRMESIDISVEKIRTITIKRVEEVIKQVSEHLNAPQEQTLIGGDTWYFLFDDFSDGITFGCGLLYKLYDLVINHSIFYIKPSMAINVGPAQFDGERFLDNESIKTYRKADKGEPFTFYALGTAITQAKYMGNIELKPIDDDSMSINWIQLGEILNRSGLKFTAINVSHILLNNEIQYFRSTEDVIRNFIRLQESASVVSAFGGAVPYDTDYYSDYLKSMKRLIESKSCKCSVITYINPSVNKKYSYFWLKWCSYFAQNYPEYFTITAYEISNMSAKPVSFHIYDKSLVHIGLREYSLHKNQSVMSASILLKNNDVANRFYSEFQENFRGINMINNVAILGALEASIEKRDKIEAENALRELLD